MATATATVRDRTKAQGKVTSRGGGAVVLHRVPYEVFDQLCQEPANRFLRMTYRDGTLEIMSPIGYEHENTSEWFGMIIRAVTSELGITCKGVGSAMFHRAGPRPLKGHGKQPDRCYYIANASRMYGKKKADMAAGDPPPDLWIEVDDRGSSRKRFPIFAALGVPELWRYRVKSKKLEFFGLQGAVYQPIERSQALPMLTPALVLEAFALGSDGDESLWDRSLRAWVREKFVHQPG